MGPPNSKHKPPALYFDEDSSNQVVIEALREEGYEVLSTPEAGNRGKSDGKQLEFATSQERALFSFNRGDFKRIHKEWWEKGWEHFGIILATQQKVTEKGLIKQLKINILERYSKEQLKNQIFWLTD